MKVKNQDIFIITYVLFIFNQIISESQYTKIGVISSFLFAMRIGLLIVFAFVIAQRQNFMTMQCYLILSLLLLAIILNLIFFDGGLTAIYVFIVAFASKNVSLEKICKATLFTIIISNLFVILSSQIGIIEDDVGTRMISSNVVSLLSGEYTRHSMGFLVSNQVPITFLILYLIFVIWKKDEIPVWFNIGILVLNFIIFYFFGARTIFLLVMMTIILYYIVIFIDKIICIRIKRMPISPIVFTFIICCLVSFGICFAYDSDSSFFYYLDTFFNHRISMAHDALNYYGITLLGLGKIAGTYEGELNALMANTVDNGYILLVIQRGLIIAIVVVMALSYLIKIAVNKKNLYLLLALVVFAVENMINADLISYRSVILYCFIFNQSDTLLEGQDKSDAKRNRIKLIK